jgi:glycosyltransferase involved in cell wall biosynthesis
MLTIIIPSRNEEFLTKTIKDVLEKATGQIEVFPIIDGEEPTELVEDPRVTYLRLPRKHKTLQKRHGINLAASKAKGEYIMWCDAHCMFDKGFDEVLIRDHQPNWVQVPRRYSLDPDSWAIRTWNPTVDYELIYYRDLFEGKIINTRLWKARAQERAGIMIDDVMTLQGSCAFMTKDWFNKMGYMQIEGYTGWGQEGEEICFKTCLNGGRVVVNKNTWYAHLHKGNQYKRTFLLTRHQIKVSRDFSYDYWVLKQKEFFISHIERFLPISGWPEDWREKIWTP